MSSINILSSLRPLKGLLSPQRGCHLCGPCVAYGSSLLLMKVNARGRWFRAGRLRPLGPGLVATPQNGAGSEQGGGCLQEKS